MQMWKMKRALSESDCDDVFSDEQSKDCSSPGDVESCGGGGLTRKRRRGIIEKRRRDRINNSLSELRRLVPAAFEKQGSAKLEKAEILQLTVDHLKTLHAKGFDALAYDPHKFAMDYHSIGFRECAAEVARYMVTVEGMDIQDPLRLRLMSHLQCFAAQRELANKQASNTWAFPPHVSNAYPPPPANSMGLAPPPAAAVSSSHPHGMLSHNSNPQATPTSSGFYDPSSSLAMNGYSHSSQLTNMDALGNPGCSSVSAATNRLHQPQPHHHHQTPMAAVVASNATITNGNPAVSTNSQYHVNLQAHPFQLAPNSYAPSTGKPYRPWGTELAY